MDNGLSSRHGSRDHAAGGKGGWTPENCAPNITPPRNALAAWAYGLGIASLVLSLVVVGGLVGLVAVVLGIIAVTRPGRKNMAVTGIVAGGLSVAFVTVFSWLFFLQAHPRLEVARRQGTIAEISWTKTALRVFETDVGHYPTTAEGLQALVTPPAGIGCVTSYAACRNSRPYHQ